MHGTAPTHEAVRSRPKWHHGPPKSPTRPSLVVPSPVSSPTSDSPQALPAFWTHVPERLQPAFKPGFVDSVVDGMRADYKHAVRRVAAQRHAGRLRKILSGPRVFLSLIDQALDKKRAAAARLISLMPHHAVLTTLGDDEEGVARDTTRAVTRLVDHFVKWSTGSILGGVNVWTRLLKYHRFHDLPFSDDRVKGSDLAAFLKDIDDQAHAKAVKSAGVRRRGLAKVINKDATSTSRSTKRINSGKSAAISAGGYLKWLQRRAGFSRILEYSPATASAAPRRRAKANDPSPSLTPGIMIRIELASVDERVPIHVRGACSFLCRMAYAALRETQAQTSVILSRDFGSETGESTGCTLGITEADKHPDPALARPAGWFCVNQGLVTGTRWQEAEAVALEGVADGGGYFLGRDTDSSTGDPNDASTTMFVDSPITGKRFLAMFRGILHHQVGLSIQEAEAFTVSSIRSFLPECAALVRTMSPEESAEIGRWGDCAFKAAGVLTPPQRRDADYDERVAALPQRYASEVTILNSARLACMSLGLLRRKILWLGNPLDVKPLGHWHQFDADLSVAPSRAVVSLSGVSTPSGPAVSRDGDHPSPFGAGALRAPGAPRSRGLRA